MRNIPDFDTELSQAVEFVLGSDLAQRALIRPPFQNYTNIVIHLLQSINGRSDLFIKPIDCEDTAIVIEIKVATNIAELQAKAEAAIRQIVDRGYEQELLDDGYIKTKRYGVAFFKKNCLVITK